MKPPLISIITVVFNGKNVLERTIQSVLNQTYKDIEYIIVDGGSIDGTVEMIRKYSGSSSSSGSFCWVSEKDNGIYDAMNKGMKMAKGDYFLFLNAGDELNEKDTLEKIFNPSLTLPNREGTAPLSFGEGLGVRLADIYYGETVLVDFDGKILGTRSELVTRPLPQNLNWKSLEKGMVVCHQSFIVKKNIAPLYDLQYRYAADIDWVIACLKKANTIVNVNFIISKFLVGGFSKKNRFQSWMDRFNVMQKHYGFLKTISSHFFFLIRAIEFKMKSRNS